MGPKQLRRVFGQLVRFETELWNAVDSELRGQHDLPLSRFEPMQVIAERGSCRVYDIASALAITDGGASKLVDRIETAGLCRRRPNLEDGRSSMIELTAAGHQLLSEATVTLDRQLRLRLEAPLGRPDLREFANSLNVLRIAMAEEALSAGLSA